MNNPIIAIEKGKAKITEHAKMNVWLNDIIEAHGEQTATKIFTVFHYMADMGPDNPYSNFAEYEKLEKIIHNVCPELPLTVDWNTYEMENALEQVREMYSTPSYRFYLSQKENLDRAIMLLNNTPFNASKELGNAQQITAWKKYITEAKDTVKQAYAEFMTEQGTVRIRGQKEQGANMRRAGKTKDLK